MAVDMVGETGALKAVPRDSYVAIVWKTEEGETPYLLWSDNSKLEYVVPEKEGKIGEELIEKADYYRESRFDSGYVEEHREVSQASLDGIKHILDKAVLDRDPEEEGLTGAL